MVHIWGRRVVLLVALAVSIAGIGASGASAAESMSLYTPFPTITVTPGESITYL